MLHLPRQKIAAAEKKVQEALNIAGWPEADLPLPLSLIIQLVTFVKDEVSLKLKWSAVES